MRVSKHGQEIKATLTGGFFLWWGDFFAIMPTPAYLSHRSRKRIDRQMAIALCASRVFVSKHSPDRKQVNSCIN
jgi:hypothetical protein